MFHLVIVVDIIVIDNGLLLHVYMFINNFCSANADAGLSTMAQELQRIISV